MCESGWEIGGRRKEGYTVVRVCATRELIEIRRSRERERTVPRTKVRSISFSVQHTLIR